MQFEQNQQNWKFNQNFRQTFIGNWPANVWGIYVLWFKIKTVQTENNNESF